MTIVFDAPVEPDALTTFIRETPIPADLTLLAEAGENFVQSNVIDWAEITRTNRTARFRTYDGRIHVSERDTAVEKQVKLPPVSSSLSMGEYEKLQLQFAQTGGTRREALANAIYNDGEKLTREVQARFEQAIGDLVGDGVLSINENGFVGTYDGGVPANQIVNAGVAWTDTTNAVILTNLVAWNDVQVANGYNGERVIRTSQAVIRLMQRNKEIIDAVHGATAARTRVTLTELNDLLSSEGLPTVRAAYDTQVDVDGSTVRVIPADKVLLTPVSLADLVTVNFGISATALELVNSNKSDLSFEDAPGIVGIVEKAGPPYREFTFVDAVGMPTLVDGRRLFIADIGTIS
ncbi:MAG: hypothetical protein JWN67_5031 [Actinomycetia bacterium]|nr:hypothetical protein [Actinomycetes bacterium]